MRSNEELACFREIFKLLALIAHHCIKIYTDLSELIIVFFKAL